MAEPKIQQNMVDGVWIRQIKFNNGDIFPGHKHMHNHITLLASGKLQVTVEGEVSIYEAPHMIFIHKDYNHNLQALADNTVAYCIHAVRDKNTGEILEGLKIPMYSIENIIKL